MSDFKFGDIKEQIIGAAFRIHNTLGCGFQEVIYQRALELEFKAMELMYAREFEMPVYYMDQEIGLLINFGGKRLEFHRFTNKKFNPTIHHPTPSQSS